MKREIEKEQDAGTRIQSFPRSLLSLTFFQVHHASICPNDIHYLQRIPLKQRLSNMSGEEKVAILQDKYHVKSIDGPRLMDVE